MDRKTVIPYATWSRIVFGQLTLNALAQMEGALPQTKTAALELDLAVKEITFDSIPDNALSAVQEALCEPVETWKPTGGAA